MKPNNMKPNNRIALVVGGSRGIGRAVSLRLADSGFNLWLSYNSSKDAALEVKKDIE